MSSFTTVSIKTEIANKLKERAEKEKRSLSSLVSFILEEKLNEA